MKRFASLIVPACLAAFTSAVFAVDPGKLTVDASKTGAKIGPLFYGLMTEEINHSYDGGLYAELIQNRIFQNADTPADWSVVQSGTGAGAISIDENDPVNKTALTRSLKLDITTIANGQRVGIANDGYWGIPVQPNTKYHASFYAKASADFTGPLTVDIESNDGSTTFATATVSAITNGWKKYDVDLSTAAVPVSTTNRFVISAGSKGQVWFSLVSLFPPTYNNRPNGNRIDLMQKLADLHPRFLRFPGGNFLEGDQIASRFNWKTTIGPLEDRPGHPGCWSYRASDGLGLLEFLEWCEDLHMEPLLAVYDGYSLQHVHVNPGPDMEPFVQEDLDEIEYCTGDVTTKWGKVRADNGHPAPFVIHYIEIGNEDWFDTTGSYEARFAQAFDAIKAKYPQLKCIATTNVKSRKPDLIDDHGYPSPRAMLRQVHRYDNYNNDRAKVFFGEWATQDGKPTPTMRAAIADAAWMTGLQTDADTVLMNCYAPLFTRTNPGGYQWPTNLIGFDSATSFGSPSYYAQSMFSNNLGDTNIDSTVEPQKVELPPLPTPKGGIGLGTWHTAAEYKDIKVTQGDTILAQIDLTDDLQGWRKGTGDWAVKDGALQQTGMGTEYRITTGDTTWQDYTVTLKARKISGDEGFMVLFDAQNRRNYRWFNVGGWKNTQAGIEDTTDGSRTAIGDPVPFVVETGRWYDLKVEAKGTSIKCYMDDKLILDVTDKNTQPAQTLFAAASKVDSTGEVILKVVNTVAVPQTIQINVQGMNAIAKEASIQTLEGDPNIMNSVEEPTRIAPKTSTIEDAGPSFTHEFPANSVSVIHLKPQ